MRVPISGTSAYKYEQKVITTRRVVKKNTKASKRRTRNNILSISVVTLLAFLMLGRNACITEKSTQLAVLQNNYETINSKVVGRLFELEQKTDLKKIAEAASVQLGMKTPEKHQLVYIDMQNADYAENTAQKSNPFFAAISGSLSKVLEYFG